MYLIAWLRPVMPFIEYEINKKYIAEILCENKAKPEMKCNGKCHLKKQLKIANDEPEERSSPIPTYSKTEDLTTLLFERKLQCLNSIEINKIIVPFNNHYKFKWDNRIFHPPKLQS